ncbi:App1 family protein [Myxococcus stipitatus]|uniref:phosphatidate phosphatase App1 family protein n=1 Tax=Myxococcus stipitatus TaxID=83455 RepID=UPI0030D0BDB0
MKEAPSESSTALSRNLRRLAAPNWVGAQVTVRFQDVTALVTSRDDGGFEVNLMPPEGQRFKVGASEAQASVEGASTTARVEVMPESTPLLVVSDFDDTLALTHVTKPAKLVQSALLKDSDSQEVVQGMAGFYKCLRGASPPSFALVSGSPIQYLPRVRGFLERHEFPAGFGVYLRDLGPGSLSGYKQPIIRRLLMQFPLPVVLVGDSGEKDPEIYAQIREEFPGRVKAIYIRDAGRSDDAKRFPGMVLFKDAKEAADHAVGLGLADASCVTSAWARPPPATPPVSAGKPAP